MISFWRDCNAPLPRLWRRLSAALVIAGLCAVASTAPLSAQNSVQGVPNALQGFSQNRDKPIKIEAADLVMRDKKKEATFKGNVRVTQGDTTLTAKILEVYYEAKEASKDGSKDASKDGSREGSRQGSKAGQGGAKMQSAAPGPNGGSSQIRRLVARDNVVVLQKDRRVSGDIAIFEAQSNQITMTGNVILTQTDCANTLKGDRLKVDMTSGVSRVESDTRISAEFNSGCGSKGEAASPADPD